MFRKLCLVDHVSVVTTLLGNTFYTVGKPVNFLFKCRPMCKEHAFAG